MNPSIRIFKYTLRQPQFTLNLKSKKNDAGSSLREVAVGKCRSINLHRGEAVQTESK